MRRTLAQVQALATTASGAAAVRLRAAPGAIPAPGQISLACRPGAEDPLRQMLVPIELHPDGFTCLQPEAARWLPGDDVDLLGPIGRGFSPPPDRARWLLAAFGLPPEVLLPLLTKGLARGVELAVWSEERGEYPPQVEVLPVLAPAIAWADYVALACSSDGLVRLGADPELRDLRRLARAVEVLFLPRMACGIGVCGACAIEGHPKHPRACSDGPVFRLEDVLP
jgi:dihydroorotate dehydrogenase electron transfer subunit